MKTYHIYLLISMLYFIFLTTVNPTQANDNGFWELNTDKIVKLCNSKKTCGACITADPQCGWCKVRDFSKDKHRCDLVTNFVAGKACIGADLVNPEKTMKLVLDKDLSEPGADPKDIVQIAPQEINLKLRPGEPFPVMLNFRQAEDYPVDLYYLMDLSKSMEDDKDNLAELGNLLAERMSNITKNFHLGFGSFVDKVVMPYVSTVPEKLIHPCTGCAAPYGFKNHMPLAIQTDRFSKQVKQAPVSGNLDAPEGGFDAIMQSIVCEKQIGWRKQSRKLLVFSTDSGFHYAGDGKLGGIVKPNDGECHLDGDGLYTESTNQDYPSLSQLNQKAIEKKVNMIFAVTASQVDLYERLSLHLEGATTGKLRNDSSNVVELIRDQYQKITSSVELKHNASNGVQITFSSQCLSGNVEETNICTGLQVGTRISFEAQIKLNSCPKDPKDWHQTITISPVGLSEAVTVNLEMICECDCEKPDQEIRDSDYCSMGNGTYECGVCSCYNNRLGQTCECRADDVNLQEKNDTCREKNESSICNDHGDCVCGQCICYNDPPKNYTGTFCECDNTRCNYHEGKMCNDKGYCDCGNCSCEQGWSGDSCECYDGHEFCKPPDSTGPLCSGHGNCTCGKCVCGEDANGQTYLGPHCEECVNCASLKCSDYRHCIQCKAFKSGMYSEEECETKCTNPKELIYVDEAKAENATEKECKYTDVDDCDFKFVYGYNATNHIYIRVQRTKDCPPPLNILMIVLGVIGGIVAIGLCLLLIWKLLTTIHDRREFAKFEKERQMAKWDTGENPIFKHATSTFKNPTYGGK